MAEGMSGSWVSTDRGRHLRKRKKAGTGPEILLRHQLHRLGLRYRVNHFLARRCRPDILFPRGKLAVFVDGCFWHRCPDHGRGKFSGPNAPLWEAKMRRNQLNDAYSTRIACELGYSPLRIWECEISRDLEAAVSRVLDALEKL